MRGVVAWMLALGACSHPSGVEIEVVPPAGTSFDTVTVFVGDGSNATIDVVPPSASARLSGTGWQHDPPFLACGTESTKPCAPQQRFMYEVGATSMLDSLIAIATSGQATFAAQQDHIAIPDGALDLVRLAFAPRSNTLDAQAWSPDPASGVTTPCARYQDASTSRFVVDLADPDCDGYPQDDVRECLPDVYMGTRGPNRANEMACANNFMVASGEVCKLAGASCTDGSGPDKTACSESAVCVPKTACDACVQSGTAQGASGELACLEDMSQNHVFQSSNNPTHIACRLDVQTAPSFRICGGQASLPLGLPTTAHCATAVIHTGNLTSSWSSSTTLASGATVTVDAQASCSLMISSTPSIQATTGVDDGALVLVGLDDGRGIAIPVDIVYNVLGTTETCAVSSALGCTLVVSQQDNLTQCLADPIPPNTFFGGP